MLYLSFGSIGLLHHHNTFEMRVAGRSYHVSRDLVSGLDPIKSLVIGNGIRHGHRRHEARNVFAVYDDTLLLTVNGDDSAFKVIPLSSRIRRWLRRTPAAGGLETAAPIIPTGQSDEHNRRF